MKYTEPQYMTFLNFMKTLDGDIRSLKKVYGNSNVRFLIQNHRGGVNVFEIDDFGEMAEYRLSSHARRELQIGDYYLYNPEEKSYQGGEFNSFIDGLERTTRVLVTHKPDDLSKEDVQYLKEIEKEKLLRQRRAIDAQIFSLSE